jgi:hypothetical protein
MFRAPAPLKDRWLQLAGDERMLTSLFGWRPSHSATRRAGLAQERFAADDRASVLDALSPDMRGQVGAILKAGRRIPEEVLAPEELRRAWS